MAKLHISQAARAELRKITRYTLRTWGKPQAQKYTASLRNRLLEIAAKLPKGKNRESISPGLRSVSHASHVIYYFIRPDEVLIANVLHYAMDPLLHLVLPE